MPSDKNYLDFILNQLSDLEEVTYRPMMGEYILYYKGKVIGGIYDDRFLVKITKASQRLMHDAERQLPYEGGKEMLAVSDVENKIFLKNLFEQMEKELPEKRKKKVS